MPLILTLALAARAYTIRLDTGATIEGDLARYEIGGDCQISVTDGELMGAIVLVPCQRVASFVRTDLRAPVPLGLAPPPPLPPSTPGGVVVAPLAPTPDTIAPASADALVAEPPTHERVEEAPLDPDDRITLPPYPDEPTPPASSRPIRF